MYLKLFYFHYSHCVVHKLPPKHTDTAGTSMTENQRTILVLKKMVLFASLIHTHTSSESSDRIESFRIPV